MASICQTTGYIGDENEYKKTKHILIKHVCDIFAEAGQ